jgi:hypothetical protein
VDEEEYSVLDAIDRIEVQMRRKNEVAPPPVCSMELLQLKEKARGRDRGR